MRDIQRSTAKNEATFRFDTSIHCGGCIRSVTPHMHKVPGLRNWTVDTDDPSKILTASGSMSADAIVRAVRDAGFAITPLDAN